MGKINIWELLVIVLALLWLFGYFRKLARNSTPQNHAQQQDRFRVKREEKKPLYGDQEGEFIDYEEVD